MSTLGPQQILINIPGPRELDVVISQMVKISQQLVCLCATDQQREWLMRQDCFKSAGQDVIFLSLNKLCQVRRQSRHLKNRVWLLWPFEFLWHTEAYFEIAENVAHIWAFSWAMTAKEQLEWFKMAKNSQLTPQYVGVPKGRFALFLQERWQRQKREWLKEQCRKGSSLELVYSDEQELRAWLRWSQREGLVVRQSSLQKHYHLRPHSIERLGFMTPEELSGQRFLFTPKAQKTFQARYARAFHDTFEHSALLLRCAKLMALVCSGFLRWF